MSETRQLMELLHKELSQLILEYLPISIVGIRDSDEYGDGSEYTIDLQFPLFEQGQLVIFVDGRSHGCYRWAFPPIVYCPEEETEFTDADLFQVSYIPGPTEATFKLETNFGDMIFKASGCGNYGEHSVNVTCTHLIPLKIEGEVYYTKSTSFLL